MENKIKIFYHDVFGEVRTLTIAGKPWWVLKDVCTALEMGGNRAGEVIKRLDEDEYDAIGLTDSLGRMQKTYIVNESGLYNVILRSDKPQAKIFRKWITSEVIPAIRKTGGYVSNEELFMETYLPFADDSVRELFRLNLKVIRQLNEKIKQDKPLVDFANHVGRSENLIDMGTMAKLAEKETENIRIGRNRLFKWLREKGVLMNNNLPYQRYIEDGYFQVCDADGGSKDKPLIFPQTMVTGKGQIYIITRLRAEYTKE